MYQNLRRENFRDIDKMTDGWYTDPAYLCHFQNWRSPKICPLALENIS